MTAKEYMRGCLRAIGFSLHQSDKMIDWFTPSVDIDDFYDVRFKLPFHTLLCHQDEGGLVVYYDKPNFESNVCPCCLGIGREGAV